jgi:beta-glucosidase
MDDDTDGLIAAVAAANPKTIVVAMTGSAATMPWIDSVPAVLAAWYPGERGGHAIARVLFGHVNPSGRLPITFPRRVEDLPTAGSTAAYPGTEDKVIYSERLEMGYRSYDARGIEPLFPFGHGLSYGGRFTYSKPNASRRAIAFTVTNRGTRTATDVPQVYASLPAAAGEPPRRLVGWRKLTLAPGASRRVRVPLTARLLSIWDTRWKVVPGTYRFSIGASSRDLPLTDFVRVP